MSWFATDDGFWSHRKTMLMRGSPYYTDAVALWTLAGSWCCDQEDEWITGRVPIGVLAGFGVKRWQKALDLLVQVGLWDMPDGDMAYFHDWEHWNGPQAKLNRSREQTRKRTAEWRQRKKHGPSDGDVTSPGDGEVTPSGNGHGNGHGSLSTHLQNKRRS